MRPRRHSAALCDRRGFFRVGGGLALAAFASPLAGAASVRSAAGGRAKSCILVYLLGGPPQLDTFDLKPDAPAEIRGPFRPIATNVPGIEICEHLPRLARRADRYALVRSVSHPNSNHTPMIYYTLTGRHTALPNQDNDTRPPQRSDFPHVGSLVARHVAANPVLPGFVSIPDLAIRSSTLGEFKRARLPLRGGAAGFLGPEFDPLAINGTPGARGAVPSLELPAGVVAERFTTRAELLSVLESRGSKSGDRFRTLRDRAIVLTGAANRGQSQVFTLDDEPPALRERYGRHRFGDALMLARRLTEAGVPMVAVHFNEMTVCDGWDTHSQNFEALRTELLPMLDQGLSALFDDLHDRGRLDETLVVCMGEFGRTPKINANAGRDHWGDCSTTLLAGGGIRGGQVLGASDRSAAFPAHDRVDPIDIHATMFHCLGVDLNIEMHDHLARPFKLCDGKPLRTLTGV